MAQVEGGGIVLLPGEGKQVAMGGFDVSFLGTRDVTQGAYSLIQTSEAKAGEGPPLHRHRDAAESFYVVAGAYSMHLDGREFHCPAGSYIYIPAGMAHTFSVIEPASRKLNLYTPAAMEGYFEELAAAIERGVDEAGLNDIAERYEMEVIGPAPDGYLNRRE